jgi:hypothetical protein
VAFSERAPVLCEPLTASVPDHAPDAVHAVALAADHVKVELAPLEMLVGLALNERVGAGLATVTIAD